jgi:glucokinase
MTRRAGGIEFCAVAPLRGKSPLHVTDESPFIVAYERFRSREYAYLDDIVRAFVSAHDLRITQACFGVAGPVQHGRCEATNLAWIVDARELAPVVGLETVWIINDLEANAYGIAALGAEDVVTLNVGAADVEGNAAVIAAGTGLGEIGLYWGGTQHWPFATEGGHTCFAPVDALQVELLRYLLRRFKRVSWERVLLGPALHNISLFLRDTGRGEEPAWLQAEMQPHDPPGSFREPPWKALRRFACRPLICLRRATAPRPAIWRSRSWPGLGCAWAAVSRRRLLRS